MIIGQNYNYVPQPIDLIDLGSDVLEFKFLNGSIYFDSSKNGAYVLNPGCGSGKTTVVKKLMSIKWYEGMLYTAFTRDEINKMYDYLISNVVGKSVDPKGNVLEKEDILVLHSDYSKAGTDKDLWLNRPQELADKKIILCTHAKLLDEPMNLLFNSNFSGSLADTLGPLHSSLVGSKTQLPRQWILIDESTEARKLKFRVTRQDLLILGTFIDRLNNVMRCNNNGTYTYSSTPLTKRMLVRRENSYIKFKENIYDIKDFDPNQFPQIKPANNELNKIRNDQFIETLFYKYHDLTGINKPYVDLTFSFMDLLTGVSNINSKVILLDGTSDITLSNSRVFKLLSIDDKYNSKVNLSVFPFTMSRYLKPNSGINDINSYLKSEVLKLCHELKNIIESNEKTLIFTWMNLKSIESVEVNDNYDKFDFDKDYSDPDSEMKIATESVVKSNSIVINDEIYFYRYLKDVLDELGVDRSKYAIEYYGSGKDKAINDYKDYDAVVLAGSYHVPNYVIDEFNDMFGTRITEVEYYTNRAVQAICRTRIRKHNSEPINVYISSDWNRNIITAIGNYFNSGSINTVLSPNNYKYYKYDEIVEILKNNGVTPKRAEKIAMLCLIDENILRAIETNTAYSTELKLDEVFLVLPMTEKKVSKYIRILEYLHNRYIIDIKLV